MAIETAVESPLNTSTAAGPTPGDVIVTDNLWKTYEMGDQQVHALRGVNLGTRMLHKPNELSGGQRQRVAIARALINNPSIILADEPTGNLDSKTGDEIMALFDELHANGNTIIVVTHEPDIAEYAHRVVTIRDGVIASDHPSARIHARSHKPTT